MAAFSLAELEAAAKSLPRGKAPGLDGIPYDFYLRFWPELGQELTDMLQEAFSSDACPALPPRLLQGPLSCTRGRERTGSLRPATAPSRC